MAVAEFGSKQNLEELRGQLASTLALGVMAGSVILMWWTLSWDPFPIPIFLQFLLLVLLAREARVRAPQRPGLARHLLVGVLALAYLMAMWQFAPTWFPFVGLVVVLVSAMLVSGSEFAVAAVLAAAVVGLNSALGRGYPLGEFIVALVLDVALARLFIRTLYTALDWAWTSQQRADRLLEVARDTQGDLGRALRSLDKTNWILRRTQRELISARREAEEARLLKERFAANISHELRTPLNLILGFSEMMYLSSDVYGLMEWPPSLRQDVYQVYQNSRHLLEMIDDVLDLSRIDMSEFTLAIETTAIGPLVEESAAIVADFFRGRPVRLEVSVEDGLPELSIDPTRIRQVLLNLLNNAQRHTDAGSVRVEAVRRDDEVCISVRDTGIGMASDQAARVFDEFYQVDRSISGKAKGAGLGLAICRRFVEAHGGRIWVESQEGVGSLFSFTIPIPGESIRLAHLAREATRDKAGPIERKVVMVVDPDPVVGSVLERHLAEASIVQIREVHGLADGILLHHPDLVVCNLPPGHDEVLGRECDLEGVVRSLPFVSCSLPSQAWVRHDLAVAGSLNKPVTAEGLLAAIDSIENVRSILIVDDDRGFCRLVERMLQASGRDYLLRQAYDGRSGLAEMRLRRPDLVLLDLIMPEVDGFEVLEQMCQDLRLSDVPVVLLSATNVAEMALKRRGGRMVIRRADAFQPMEIVRSLEAIMGVLSPQYDERFAPVELRGEDRV
ncbi:MAG: hybrid sensor histidine kinase/response regulator [Chloroflexi bacterium]|nr:hybrid sensor histidine kinase/response regulator [Chloroflexota bacterium]